MSGRPLAVAVRAVSHGLHLAARTLRLVRLNATTFVFHRPLPWSTVVYGRVRVLHRPCRFEAGRRCRLGDGLYLATSLTSTIRLGDDVTVQLGCVMVAMERIAIGDRVAIAEYVTIRDQEHRFAPGHGVRGQGYVMAPVEIGDNVWLGRGAYLGPGTTIGADSIVGANSVVRGSFPPGVLIAGAPAVVKKVLAPGEGPAASPALSPSPSPAPSPAPAPAPAPSPSPSPAPSPAGEAARG